jgi:hypothetical protein
MPSECPPTQENADLQSAEQVRKKLKPCEYRALTKKATLKYDRVKNKTNHWKNDPEDDVESILFFS